MRVFQAPLLAASVFPSPISAQSSSSTLTSSASFQYPDKADTYTYNYNDVVVIAWKSNFQTARLVLNCANDSSNVLNGALITSYEGNFPVNPSDTLQYTLEKNDPDQSEYPFLCSPQILAGDEKFGLDGPHIFFTSTTGLPTTYGLGLTLAASSTVTSVSQTSSSTSVTTTANTAVSQTTSQIVTQTSPPATTSDVASSSLSAGAKAGIGIAAVGGVVAVAAALGWFILSRRRKAKATSRPGSGSHSQGQYMDQQYMQAYPGPVKGDQSTTGSERKYYSPVHEVDSTMTPYQHEMPAHNMSHEMDAPWSRR